MDEVAAEGGSSLRAWASRAGAGLEGGRVGFVLVAAFLARSQRFAFSGDITGGDTAFYYAGALETASGFDFAWSPLYHGFLAALIAVFERPEGVVAAQRVGGVVACTALVFLIARRLLPGWLAVVASLAWVVSPINHDPFYGIHLFSFSFFLLALWASTWETAAGRAVALGALLLLTLTLRSEYALTLVPFAAWVWACDWRRATASPLSRVAQATPVFLALLATGFFLAHNAYPVAEIPQALRGKQAFNFSQNYAFVHGVRDPSWSDRPFDDYEALVEDVFGKPRVTLGEAAVANPLALLEHVATNAWLTPAGMQASLFFSSGSRSHPEYRRPPRRTVVAWGLWGVVVGLSVAGARHALRSPKLRRRLRKHRSAWGMLALAGASGLAIGLLVVPRTTVTYASNLAILLWACVGLGAVVGARGRTDAARVVAVCAIVLLAVVAPSGWEDGPQTHRPLKTSLDRLWPHRDHLSSGIPAAVLTTGRTEEVGLFLGIRKGETPTLLAYEEVAAGLGDGVGLADALDARGARLFEIAPEISEEPAVQGFLGSAAARGWQLHPCPVGPGEGCHIALR